MQKFLFLLSFLFYLNINAEPIHPYHVGSVEFKYNERSKTFEISAKFFLDDLENSLNDKYGRVIHFNDENFKQEINKLLENYCRNYLKLKVNNQFIKLNYLGFEENAESVDVYLESTPVEAPKKVETAVSFLYNYFNDQMNIVHIIVNGERKSSKLNYPDRYLFQEF